MRYYKCIKWCCDPKVSFSARDVHTPTACCSYWGPGRFLRPYWLTKLQRVKVKLYWVCHKVFISFHRYVSSSPSTHKYNNNNSSSAQSVHAGFSACVIFKDAGPPPAKLGSSSFSAAIQIKQTRLAKQKPHNAYFLAATVALFRRWGSFLIGTHPVSQTLEGVCDAAEIFPVSSSPLWWENILPGVLHAHTEQQTLLSLFPSSQTVWAPPHDLPHALLHAKAVLTCWQVYRSRCSLSPKVTLRGPKGPMEGYYYPLSKWTEGDHKTPLLSCSDGNPTPVEPLERPGKWVQESRGLWSPPLRYHQHCQHHAWLPIWEKTPVWHQSEPFKC